MILSALQDAAASARLVCVITPGEAGEQTYSADKDRLAVQAAASVAAGADLIQLREKHLPARLVLELAESFVRLADGTPTRIVVNDRADVAVAAGAAGVHLTSTSLLPRVVREAFGDRLIIGVSAHSVGEVLSAREGGADYVTFSPVFETESKRAFGPPQGIGRLREAVEAASGMPVFALGGISVSNASECFSAGAAGVAGIRLFREPDEIGPRTEALRLAGRVYDGRSE